MKSQDQDNSKEQSKDGAQSMPRKIELGQAGVNVSPEQREQKALEETLKLINAGDKLSCDNDKSAVLVIGKTGVGKSTLVNYLAGAELEYVEHVTNTTNSRGRAAVVKKYVLEVKEPLGEVKPGHSNISMTAIPNKWHDNTANITYWDCPGFEDNRGAEQDIANAFYVKKLFDIPKLKLMLVVQGTTFEEDKGSAFVNLVKKLAYLIQDFNNFKESFSLVVTKTSHDSSYFQDRIKTLFSDNESSLTQVEGDILDFLGYEEGKIAVFSTPQKVGVLGEQNRQEILSLLSKTEYVDSSEVKITVSDKSLLTVRNLAEKVNDMIVDSVKNLCDDIQHGYMQRLSDVNSNASDLYDKLDKFVQLESSHNSQLERFVKLGESSSKNLIVQVRDELKSIEKLLQDTVLFTKLLQHLEHIDFFQKVSSEAIGSIRPAEWIQQLEHLNLGIKVKYTEAVNGFSKTVVAEIEESMKQLLGKVTDHCNQQKSVVTLESLKSIGDVKAALSQVIDNAKTTQTTQTIDYIAGNIAELLLKPFSITTDLVGKVSANAGILEKIITLNSSVIDKKAAVVKLCISQLETSNDHVVSGIYNNLSRKLVDNAKDFITQSIDDFVHEVTQYANDNADKIDMLSDVFNKHLADTSTATDIRDILNNIREYCLNNNIAGIKILNLMLAKIEEVKALDGAECLFKPDICKQEFGKIPEAIKNTESFLVMQKLDNNINYFADAIHEYVDIEIPKEPNIKSIRSKVEEVKEWFPKMDKLFMNHSTVDKLVPLVLDISSKKGVRLDGHTRKNLQEIEDHPLELAKGCKSLEKVVDLINYLKQENKWYKSIDTIYKKLSSPSCVFDHKDSNGDAIDPNKYKVIDDNKFNDLVKMLGCGELTYTEHRGEQLQSLVKMTLGDEPNFTNTSGKFVATGNFVKMSDIANKVGSSTFIEVLAMDTVYFDTNITSKVGVTVVAPNWYIPSSVTINLNGDSGTSYYSRASDGSGNGCSGSTGCAGGPGASAGHFYGVIGDNISDLPKLTIYANGGSGGRGQDGGHGSSGNSGSVAGGVGRSDHCISSSDYCKWWWGGKWYHYVYRTYGSYGSSGGNGGDGGAGGYGGYGGDIQIHQSSNNLSHVAKVYASSGSTGSNGSGGSGGSGGYRGNHKEGTWCEWKNGWGCDNWGISGADREIPCYDRASSGSSGGTNWSRSSPTETATAFRNKVQTVRTDFANKLSALKDTEEFSTKIQIPFLKDFSDKNAKQLSGQGTEGSSKDFGYHEHFNHYHNEGIDNILTLRLKDIGLNNVKVLEAKFSMEDSSADVVEMIKEVIDALAENQSNKILVPYNIENKHWVGVVFEEQNGTIAITYLDSENNKAPEVLAVALSDIFNALGLEANFSQILVETQKSGNCGPEVIENFVWYLTGERLSQEEAVKFHSALVEGELMLSEGIVLFDNNSTAVVDSDNEFTLIAGEISGFYVEQLAA